MSRSLPHLVVFLVFFGWCSVTHAQEHRVEVLKEAPPEDEISKEVAARLDESGFKVIRGSSRTVCTIWPCKEWVGKPDFEATTERLYPLQAGELFGVLHFRRRGKDFRDQTIQRGWYTLRYALQPIDGNHEGTSPTRDFLVMVKAEQDQSAERMDMQELLKASAEAAGSSHPAMMCLQRANGSPEKAQVRHVEDTDWWVLQFTGTVAADEKTSDLPVDLVVAGHAEE